MSKLVYDKENVYNLLDSHLSSFHKIIFTSTPNSIFYPHL